LEVATPELMAEGFLPLAFGPTLAAVVLPAIALVLEALALDLGLRADFLAPEAFAALR